MFVDRVEIEVQAGKGGDGCCSFRRERYIPRGGPDGGDGGRGGNVVIRAQAGVDHLSALAHRRHWRADRGTHGQGSDRHGRNGKDLVIDVPPGTLIIDAADGFVIKDLTAEGDQVVAARGGQGATAMLTSSPRSIVPLGNGPRAEKARFVGWSWS